MADITPTIPDTKVTSKINPADVHSPSEIEDGAALQLVVQDAEKTEAYLQAHYWSYRWRESDVLYQALALDTPVRTKDGFKPIAEVHPGDEVFGKDGRLHKVLGESPVFTDRQCYELEFSNGQKIVADACHLWETYAHKPENGEHVAIRNTEELFKTVYYDGTYGPISFNHSIKCFLEDDLEKPPSIISTCQILIRVKEILSVPVKCLSVEGEFYLVTESLIVTHNSPPGVLLWEGTTVPRANMTRFVVAETVNSIKPQIMNGLFYEKPSFKLRPRPNMTENTSRAISALLDIQLDAIEMNFRQEVELGLDAGLIFGTGIWKWGWRQFIKKKPTYKRLESPVTVAPSIPGGQPTEIETPDSMMFEKVWEEKPFFTPTFEFRDNRYVLVDPGLSVPDIRKAKFVIDRMYLTYRDLIKLKDEEYVESYTDENGKKKQRMKKRYDLPSDTEIKSWFEEPKEEAALTGRAEALDYAQGTTMVHHALPKFQKTTEDPLNEPLEVLERWDNDKVITVLQRTKTIRNEANEFGVIPFYSLNWWNIPFAFWGMGLGRTIGVEQRIQQGLINALLDLASLIVNPMFVRARGAQIQEQMIRQRIGGIITADIGGAGQPKDVKDALVLLEQPPIPEGVVQQIALSEQRVSMTSGANEQLTMGAGTQGQKAGAFRTGTGASGLIQAVMNRIGGYAETFVRQVYEPWLYQMHAMNRDKLPIFYIQEVLGEKLGSDYKFDYADFMTAPAEFEVLAGSHLAAKSQMAQSLFMMSQMVGVPAVQQSLAEQFKTFDWEEFFHMMHDVSGWKNYYDLIKDMTPEQKQQYVQSKNMPQQKVQGQMQLNAQKANLDSQALDQENEARIARDIFRHVMEVSAMPEALSGAEAPAQGVGSNEVG